MQGAAKGSRRYRYYVSKGLVNGGAADNAKCWRLSGPELERVVATAARQILSDRAGLIDALQQSAIEAPDVRAALELSAALAQCLTKERGAAESIVELIDQVAVRDDGLLVTLRLQVPCLRSGAGPAPLLNCPASCL